MVSTSKKALWGLSAFMAIFSLFLSLLLTGCGDSGSTTPAVIAPTNKALVHFQFNLEPDARTVANTFKYYNFLAMDSDNEVTTSNLEVSKCAEYDFSLPVDTKTIVVLFLDENKIRTAVGLYNVEGRLSLDKTYNITDPNYFTFAELATRVDSFAVSTTPLGARIPVGGTLKARAIINVNVADEGQEAVLIPVNATKLCSFSIEPAEAILQNVTAEGAYSTSLSGIAEGLTTIKYTFPSKLDTPLEASATVTVSNAKVNQLTFQSTSLTTAVSDENNDVNLNILLPDFTFDGYQAQSAFEALELAKIKVIATYSDNTQGDVSDLVSLSLPENSNIALSSKLIDGYYNITALKATSQAIPLKALLVVSDSSSQANAYEVDTTANVSVLNAKAGLTITNDNLSSQGKLSLAKGLTAQLGLIGSYTSDITGAPAQYAFTIDNFTLSSDQPTKVATNGQTIEALLETEANDAIITASYKFGPTATEVISATINVAVTAAEKVGQAIISPITDGTSGYITDLPKYFVKGSTFTFFIGDVYTDNSYVIPESQDSLASGLYTTNRTPEVITNPTTKMGLLNGSAEAGSLTITFTPEATGSPVLTRNIILATPLLKIKSGGLWQDWPTSAQIPVGTDKTSFEACAFWDDNSGDLVSVDCEAANWQKSRYKDAVSQFNVVVDSNVATLSDSSDNRAEAGQYGMVVFDVTSYYSVNGHLSFVAP